MRERCAGPGRRGLLRLPWGRVFYTDDGPVQSACPLVLLHGLFFTHYTFRHVVPRLAEHTRVLALDLPGCGESDRPRPVEVDDYRVRWLATAVDATLDALRLGQVDVVGHGMGGLIAVELAVIQRRIRRLVLMAPPCFATPLPAFERMASVPFVGGALFKRAFGQPQLRWYLQRCLAVPENLDETVLRVLWDRLARAGGREAAWAMIEHLEHLEYIRDLLPKVDAPTLMIWGDDDRVVPVSAADRISALLRHVKVEVLEGCGHAIQEERPDALAQLVGDFCQAGAQ